MITAVSSTYRVKEGDKSLTFTVEEGTRVFVKTNSGDEVFKFAPSSPKMLRTLGNMLTQVADFVDTMEKGKV